MNSTATRRTTKLRILGLISSAIVLCCWSHAQVVHIEGVRLAGGAQMWQMTGPSPDAANVLDKQPEVEIKENDLTAAPETLEVAPVSITVYRFATQP